jgi:2-polyprenyl-3-methyl-5-hydroxy-6-metoxy-1,4-benzoquinol methylase
MFAVRKLLRPFAGRAVSMAAGVEKAISRVGPYIPMKGGRGHLDEQYASGEWEYLRGLGEVSRFSVVAGYCHYLKPGGAIVEIGAGDGILHERLDRSKYGRYLGLDISQAAIDRVASRKDDRTEFVAGDAAEFVPPAKFDVVVFNEVMEYFDDPSRVVGRWCEFLLPGGIIVASMFSGLNTARSERIWRALGKVFEERALTVVRNEARYEWIIKVLAPE